MTSIFTEWPGGSLESALRLGGLILVSYALVLWFSAIIWTYSDVRHRTSDQFSQLIAVLLVAVFNVPGLVIYLVIRPQATMADPYERSLESEAILHELQLSANSCQTCRRPVDDDFNICPHCRTTLRESCRNCARSIRTSWIACPYCATDRPIPVPAEPLPSQGRARPERPRTEQRPGGQRPAEQPRAEQPRAEQAVRTQPLDPPRRRSDEPQAADSTGADSGPVPARPVMPPQPSTSRRDG